MPKHLISPEMRALLKRMDQEEVIAHWLSSNMAKRFGPMGALDVPMAGAHRARVMAGRAFTRAEVDESKAWLRAHGYSVP